MILHGHPRRRWFPCFRLWLPWCLLSYPYIYSYIVCSYNSVTGIGGYLFTEDSSTTTVPFYHRLLLIFLWNFWSHLVPFVHQFERWLPSFYGGTLDDWQASLPHLTQNIQWKCDSRMAGHNSCLYWAYFFVLQSEQLLSSLLAPLSTDSVLFSGMLVY